MIIFLFSDFKLGGSQKISIDILNSIKSINSRTSVLTIENKGILKKYINKKKKIYSLNSKRALFSIYNLYKYLSKKKPEKVFCTQPHLGLIVFIVNFFLLKKVKIIVRETNTSSYENYLDVNLKKRIENTLKKFFFNYVDCVIFPSKEISYKLNSKTVVIPNFVDNQKIKNSKPSPKRNFILAMGRLTKQKGFDTLINSYLNIKNKIKQNLVIFGEGEEKNNLKKIIKKNKLENRIKIFNFTANPYAYLKSCDLFILSSRWEGMPNILIQALSCRSNILSTDCKYGPRQILKNGKLGYLCKVNDPESMSKKIMIALKKKKKIVYNEIAKYDKKKIISQYVKILS